MGDSRHPDDCQPTVEFCRQVSCFIPHPCWQPWLLNFSEFSLEGGAILNSCPQGIGYVNSYLLRTSPARSFSLPLTPLLLIVLTLYPKKSMLKQEDYNISVSHLHNNASRFVFTKGRGPPSSRPSACFWAAAMEFSLAYSTHQNSVRLKKF